VSGTVAMAGQRTAHNRARRRLSRIGLYVFLTVLAVIFLWPMVYALYTSLRPYGELVANANGAFSTPRTLNLNNYFNVWNNSDLVQYYWNTAVITIPAVLLTLWISSMLAFAISRYKWRFNLIVLMIFTAGNLLPPQIIIVPLYRLYLLLPVPAPLSDNGLMYNQFIGLILIHTTFQTGFCTFVLSNYMKALPTELTEAALVDGASVWRQYANIIMPLCRPALAAMGTLEVIFIYNDFFWPLLFIQSGDRLPVTTGIKNLQGDFLSNYNLIAAGATITIIPTLVVYLLLQRHFVAGLTLGATKG
jgi:multiple sugar transport system permease protein